MENGTCSKHRQGDLATVEECSEWANFTLEFPGIRSRKKGDYSTRRRVIDETNCHE
jgi:hypothetical protein